MFSRFGSITTVMRGIYCIPSLGIDSNIYIVDCGGGEIIVIDTGLGFEAEHVIGEIRRGGLNPENIRYIVNTHCHIDHIGGNPAFLGRCEDAKVLAHVRDARYMIVGDAIAIEPLGFVSEIKPYRVDVMLKDGDRVEAGDYIFKVVHTPGHTPGSICLYDEEYKVLISGDTVFLEGIGRYDFPYSSYRDLARSLRKLADMEVEALLPGHGPYTTRKGSSFIKENLKWIL